MCCRLVLSSLSRPIARPSLRRYSTPSGPPPKSPYAQWYSQTVPAMIPVFLLGSAVYLGLQLTQLKLSHEKYMEDASKRIQGLEAEIEALQNQRATQSKEVGNAATPALAQSKSSRSWW